MNLRRAILLPAVALIAGVLNFAPASADPGNAFDIYAVKVGDVRVNSGSCRSIPVSVYHDGGYEDVSADVEVWRGSNYVGSEYLYDSRPGRVAGSFYYCPYSDRLGKFRAGPSEVDWASDDYSYSGVFRDTTTGSFTVLQDARVTSLKAKRKGKKVTFTGRSSWYSVEASRWVADPKGWKLKLQRQLSSGRWKTIKSFRAGKKSFTVKTSRSKRAAYRVLSAAGKDTWSGTSKTVRR